MPKDYIQQQFFEYQSHGVTGALDLPDADISYFPDFLKRDFAWDVFKRLLEEIEWRQERITLYGKTHNVPRLSCWMGDPDTEYAYSNMTMHPVPWSTTLLELRGLVEQHTKCSFNSVLLNYYRDGQDSNGWHADNEPELGPDPIIASLSLGGVRDFRLRHQLQRSLKRTIALEHASLLVMRGSTQRCWQHHVPKRAQASPRLNLTFRTII